MALTLSAIGLFVLALVPRMLALDQHATADEDLTLIRSANVALALESGDWWGTYQIGHPEATVQLLVALGLGPERLRPYAGEFLGPDARTSARVPGYFQTLVAARTLMSPVHAALIVLSAALCWRLWGAAVGGLAGLLLALEPFLVAHGRILRTDALLSELMLVAVLSALAFWSRRCGFWAIIVCIAATALAALTKTPALALLGAVPAAALMGAWMSRAVEPPERPADEHARSFWQQQPRLPRAVSLFGGLGLWLLGSIGVAYAVWPALWARPFRALERMAVYTQEKGGSPMDAGGFFLGAPIPDPGPLYYAVALPLRLSPVVLLGLVLWLALRAPHVRQGLGLTLLTGLGLAVILAFLPKKADRYILPAFPFLIVIAAAGLAALAARVPRLHPAGLAGLVVAGQSAMLLLVWPYPLAAYNPLLGGAPTAADWVSVGWGEGLDQLAPVLNAQGDASSLTVSTPYPEVLQAQIAGRAVDLDAHDVAQYAVRYIAASQRHLASADLDAALAQQEPLERVTVAGVPYAELYRLDPPAFEGHLQTRNLEVTPGSTGRRGWITIRVALSAPGPAGTVPIPGQTAMLAPLEVDALLLNSADATDVEASVTRTVIPDGSVAELKLRAPNSLGRYMVGLQVREAGGALVPVQTWPIGAPRLSDRLVFPSLRVRLQ
ncbi:MAG: hypothetical protein AB7P40_04400 [Chloroflexota bacterium]